MSQDAATVRMPSILMFNIRPRHETREVLLETVATSFEIAREFDRLWGIKAVLLQQTSDPNVHLIRFMIMDPSRILPECKPSELLFLNGGFMRALTKANLANGRPLFRETMEVYMRQLSEVGDPFRTLEWERGLLIVSLMHDIVKGIVNQAVRRCPDEPVECPRGFQFLHLLDAMVDAMASRHKEHDAEIQMMLSARSTLFRHLLEKHNVMMETAPEVLHPMATELSRGFYERAISPVPRPPPPPPALGFR